MGEIKKCVLLCSRPIGPELAGEILREHQDALILCVDAGYLSAKQYHIRCDLLLGDFDSPGMESFPGDVPYRRFPKEKDYTDSTIAIMEGLEQGCREFYIYGALGGRMDHTFANIHMLGYLKDNGADGHLIDETTRMCVIENSEIQLPRREGWRFSIFPMGTEQVSVTETQVQYPLDHYPLKSCLPIGVSNEFSDSDALISVQGGKLLIMETKID